MQYYLILFNYSANYFQLYPSFWNYQDPSLLSDFQCLSNFPMTLQNNPKQNSEQCIQEEVQEREEVNCVHKQKKTTQKQKSRNQQMRSLSGDEQFRERQQTGNRNIGSNTLKMFFRQIRDPKSETSKFIQEIIEKKQLQYSMQTFLHELDRIFPKNQNYIVFDKVKSVCETPSKFGEVLRISLKRFYKFQVFCVNVKSSRTTRKIRNLQIKQGKLFLTRLFS